MVTILSCVNPSQAHPRRSQLGVDIIHEAVEARSVTVGDEKLLAVRSELVQLTVDGDYLRLGLLHQLIPPRHLIKRTISC